MKRTKSSLIRSHSRDSFSRLVFESEHSNGGGHHNRSLVYRFCQFMVLLLRSITPLSYVFLIYIAIYKVTADKFSFGCVTYWLLLVWALIEALFFPYYYYLFMKLNNLNDKLLHFAVNKETRLKLVRDCFDAMKKSTVGSDLDIPKYLRKVIIMSALITISH